MDLVSVIIPCYNVSPFIDKFFWILEQTHPELEFVLIDDCSTDDTWQKLQEFKQQYADKRIILEHNEHNLGVAETRNHGLAVSSGKYVCFWDADDRAYPLFVEKMLAKLQQEQADFVCCAYYTIDNQGIQKYRHVSKELLETQSIEELRRFVFTFESMPWLKFVRRDFIEEKGIYFPDIFIGEDHCWTTQLVLNARKIAFLNEPLYQYYIDNSSSITHAFDSRRTQGFFKRMQFDLECIKKFGLYSTRLVHDRCMYERWMIYFCEIFMYFYNGLPTDLQKKFLLDLRDFCQLHGINLTAKDLPVSYRFYSYRLLPKIGIFLQRRDKLKKGHLLYSSVRRIFTLIHQAELST